MIAPCRECGGDSFEPDHSGYTCDGECCPRCAFMPWLSAMFYGVPTLRGKPTASTALDARGKWKPDPDTVIEWCFEHDSRLWGGGTHGAIKRCEWTTDENPEHMNQCRFGWVPKPITPLMTEEDR